MTSQNSNTSVTRTVTRPRSISSVDSLLRIADAKALESQREAGTGSAVLYLRVSTQRQMMTAIDLDPDGNSIATQRESTINRAKRLKVPVIKEFVEPGQSAQSISNRPVFRELLHYVENTPEVEYVIIYMRSRVFRNQTDAAITKRILDSMGVKLISAKEEFGEGYMADAMEAITDIMNEVQVRQSGEDIKNKMYHKAKNGGTVGRARVGYLNVRKDVDGHLVNSIDIDPQRAPLVTWAFEQYATGEYTLMTLLEDLEELGLTTRRTAKWEENVISRSQLAAMLRDPYYLGMVPYKGEVFPGKHPALVTPEVFERVQQVLEVRVRRGQKDVIHKHFLRAILRCDRCRSEEHSRQLVYSRVGKETDYDYEYFLCLNRQSGACDLPHLPVALVEDAVLAEIQKLKLSRVEIETMREQVGQQLDRQLGSLRETNNRIKKELAKLDVKEESFLDLIAEGTMSTDKVRERVAKIQVQRRGLMGRLNATEDVIRQQNDVILSYLDLLERPGEFYAAADDDVKRKILNAFFSEIWLDDDDHKVIVNSKPRSEVEEIQRAAAINAETTEQTLGGSKSRAKVHILLDIFLSKVNLVDTVVSNVNEKPHILPPLPAGNR